jgi:hypothetical protein
MGVGNNNLRLETRILTTRLLLAVVKEWLNSKHISILAIDKKE